LTRSNITHAGANRIEPQTLRRTAITQPYPIRFQQQKSQSALFVLKVSEERHGDGRIEWRGEMLDLYSNVISTFEDWPDLIDLISGSLDNLPTTGQGTPQANRYASGR